MPSIKYILLAATLSLSCASLCSNSKGFDQMYVFGDSLSDYGNTFVLSGFKKPHPKYYDNGRFSNGPNWVEHLAKNLNIKNVRSFAYGGATSDDNMYKSVYLKDGVPGAVQQVEQFGEYYKNMKLGPEKCSKALVTFLFAINDFVVPGADPKKVLTNLEQSVTTLLSNYGVKHIVLPISLPISVTPKINSLPENFKAKFSQLEPALELGWKKIIKNINDKYPDVTVYKLDLKGNVEGFSNKNFTYNNISNWNIKSPCLISKEDATQTIISATKCDNPQSFIFWDGTHPSTTLHKYIADITAEEISLSLLKNGSNI